MGFKILDNIAGFKTARFFCAMIIKLLLDSVDTINKSAKPINSIASGNTRRMPNSSDAESVE